LNNFFIRRELSTVDVAALMALCTQYPTFRMAYAQRKVGHHFMVARSDPLAGLPDVAECDHGRIIRRVKAQL